MPRAKGAGSDLWPNALSPDRMTAAERLAEVGEILAAGLLRLRARRSSSDSNDLEKVSLDFTGDQSVHGHPMTESGER